MLDTMDWLPRELESAMDSVWASVQLDAHRMSLCTDAGSREAVGLGKSEYSESWRGSASPRALLNQVLLVLAARPDP